MLAVQDGLPLVSIVIPCYKQVHLLGEAIASALAQTCRRVEVVVDVLSSRPLFPDA
jgi:hypothetical protein